MYLNHFSVLKHKGSGTGLGLSMVYGFVKQSGGHIEIQSKIRQGSRIKIFLPLDSGLENCPTPDRVSISCGLDSSRILLVEDDADVRHYVSRALRRIGHNVNCVNTGDAALQALKQDPDD